MKRKIVFYVILLIIAGFGIWFYFDKEKNDETAVESKGSSIVGLNNEQIKQVASDEFEKFVLGIADGSVTYGELDTINKLTSIEVTSIKRFICDDDKETYKYVVEYTFECSDASYCFVVGQLSEDSSKTGEASVTYNLVDNNLSVKGFSSGFTCPSNLITYE